MMQNNDIIIRTASVSDAQQILDIYAPYVLNTAITFEYEVPSLEAFRQRIQNTLTKYPYIAAVRGDDILGYAYTGAFSGRAAYGWTAEVSIYLKENVRGCGLGRRLYNTIEQISTAQNILNLTAKIAYPEAEDEYLTRNSVRFHHHMGYREVGMFHNCGYKFGRWYHMVCMEKQIGAYVPAPPPVTAFPELTALRPDISRRIT